MPRLLPRLLKAITSKDLFGAETFDGPLIRKPRRRKSLWKPVQKLEDNSLSAHGRTHSLLLDDNNLITTPWKYKRHKTMPPVLKLHDQHAHRDSTLDKPREMTVEERRWWSNPYLRMLSSPIRRCITTRRHLPTDFLIRLVAVTVSTPRLSRGATSLVPDGLQHSRYTGRVRGSGNYVLCWKDVIGSMLERQSHAKLSLAANLSVHSLLVAQIGHLLRVRVLQELELLTARLRAAQRKDVNHVVIRRLTRSEWVQIKTTGLIPWEGAVCVLVVPPLNRDPRNKHRPMPNSSPLPPDSTQDITSTSESLPPLPSVSTLHPTRENKYEEPLSFLKDQQLPDGKVPLYNGLSLFPSRGQRAALHKRLREALGVEGKARSKIRSTSTERRDEKASHAFILFSTEHTVARVDSVPLAIALWRVRMWEGAGWEDGSRWQESN